MRNTTRLLEGRDKRTTLSNNTYKKIGYEIERAWNSAWCLTYSSSLRLKICLQNYRKNKQNVKSGFKRKVSNFSRL